MTEDLSKTGKISPPQNSLQNIMLSEKVQYKEIDVASLCSLAGRYDNPICHTVPAGLHRMAESIPLNRFLGSLNVYKFGL
jgi:hypothetical protein